MDDLSGTDHCLKRSAVGLVYSTELAARLTAVAKDCNKPHCGSSTRHRHVCTSLQAVADIR
ncbi:MAG: hypothetical protein ACTHJ4_08710 [Candidatus Nucleicultricaceae bacterium]